WISRALERGMSDPETHLLAAAALRRAGALTQALLHLRLAAEMDARAVARAGRLAATWVESAEEISRAAPTGSRGARLLTEAALRLAKLGKRELVKPVLRAALKRDGAHTRARLALGKQLALDLEEGRCAKALECANSALR